jgi:hypothetical protein
VLLGRSERSKELEILVLRHELAILRLKGVKTWFRRSSVDSAVFSGPLRPRRVDSRRSGSAWVSRSRLGLGA